MEQLEAREKLFRADLLDGNALPGVSELLKDARALASSLGGEASPSWLVKLAQSQEA